jgi:uncharacterized membrane protein YciS (DUF1049 family)
VERAQFSAAAGRFSTAPQDFPVIFEMGYAIKWILQGAPYARKAVLIERAAVRQAGHQSTYKDASIMALIGRKPCT